MAVQQYLALSYPERAENLDSAVFQDYRVYLDHWDSISEKLRFAFENVVRQQKTTAILLNGRQGLGKTLFARRLHLGWTLSRTSTKYDPENLWHRVTAGHLRSLDTVRNAMTNSEIIHIEDDHDWVEKAKTWRKNNETRNGVIIADNAERSYFLRSLLGLTRAQFLGLDLTREEIYREAAEEFVKLTRGDLKGCLFLFLTNDDDLRRIFLPQQSDSIKDW